LFTEKTFLIEGSMMSKISTKQVSDGLLLAPVAIANFTPQNNSVSYNIICFFLVSG